MIKSLPKPELLEIQTKSKKLLRFDIPDGEELAALRVNGKEVHETHAIALDVKKILNYWVYLFLFGIVSIFISVALSSYIIHRLNALPLDTSEIQSMIDNQHPPAFSIGDNVHDYLGKYGRVLKIGRGTKGNWIYFISGQRKWVGQRGLTYFIKPEDVVTDPPKTANAFTIPQKGSS